MPFPLERSARSCHVFFNTWISSVSNFCAAIRASWCSCPGLFPKPINPKREFFMLISEEASYFEEIIGRCNEISSISRCYICPTLRPQFLKKMFGKFKHCSRGSYLSYNWLHHSKKASNWSNYETDWQHISYTTFGTTTFILNKFLLEISDFGIQIQTKTKTKIYEKFHFLFILSWSRLCMLKYSTFNFRTDLAFWPRHFELSGLIVQTK